MPLNNNADHGKSSRANVQLFWWAAAILAAGVCITAAKAPLIGVQYDTAYYLLKAKALIEASVLSDYVESAERVSREVLDRTWDRELSYFPQAYWYFLRLGHLITLGGVIALGEGGEQRLLYAHWGYGLLLALSLVLSMILTLRLSKLFSVQSARLATGAGLSALLFMASGQYWHMTGNLVTEVPALFFAGLSLTLLVESQIRKSFALAALAGLAAFLAYATRTDFLWIPLSFAIVLAAVGKRMSMRGPWYLGLAVAGFSALLAYGSYALTFGPLADPRVFFRLWEILRDSFSNQLGEFRFRLPRMLVISGGLLWIGAVIALPTVRRQPFVLFALSWLMLLALPWILQGVSGGWGEARMLSGLLPGLFLLSSAGWSEFPGNLRTRGSRILGIAAVGSIIIFVAAVTHQTTYDALRVLPGGWRLQYARAFLRPDTYEQREYPVDDLVAIGKTLYGDDDPKVVFVGHGANRELEFLNLIRFMGPRFAPDRSLFALEPQKAWRKGIEPGVGEERVVFRNYLTEQDGWSRDQRGYRLFILSVPGDHEGAGYGDWSFDVRPLVAGKKYNLEEVVDARRN